MDKWQSSLLTQMYAFTGEQALHAEDEVNMGINATQAYVIMKALEDQEKYRDMLAKQANPLLEVRDDR